MNIHHESIIDKTTFEQIKSGFKTTKFYLNDTKRQGLKCGDIIRYSNKDTDEVILVIIENIVSADNSVDFENKNIQEYINSWFSLEDQEKYGLLSINIRRIDI